MNHTIQRQAILDELKKSGEHLSADEIFVRLRRKIPQISLATIYRNLELLSEMNLIRKTETLGFQKRFETEIKDHLHKICPHCGKISNETSKTFIELDKKIAETMKLSADTGYYFEILQTCAACKEKLNQSVKKEKPPPLSLI